MPVGAGAGAPDSPGEGAGALPGAAPAVGAAPPARRRCKISKAEIGSTRVSYLALKGLLAITALRSSGVIAPIRAEGGRIIVRSTMLGVPPASRKDTSA